MDKNTGIINGNLNLYCGEKKLTVTESAEKWPQ